MIKLSKLILEMKVPIITLYASYYLEDYSDYKYNPSFKNGLKSEWKKGANGTNNGNPVILCSKYPFNMFDEEGDEIDYVSVEFQKPLNEVFLDDEFDLDELGIGWDQEENIDKFIVANNNVISLDKLLPLGLDIDNPDLSFYGCYVKDVKSNEIIKITKEEPIGSGNRKSTII